MKVMNDYRETNYTGAAGDVLFAWGNYDPESDIAKAITPWYLCRDYLGENLWDIREGRNLKNVNNVSTYGVYIKPENTLQAGYSCLLMKLRTTTLLSNLKANLHHLNLIEEKNGFLPTRIKIGECGKSILVGGDRRWTDNNFMSSLWTYLLKIFTFRKLSEGETWPNLVGDKFYTNEYNYYESVRGCIHKVLDNLQPILDNCKTQTGYPLFTSHNFTIHSRTGFVHLIRNRGKLETNSIANYLGKTYGDVAQLYSGI